MAYRRSLITSAKLFNRHKFSPSISYIHHQNDHEKAQSSGDRLNCDGFIQRRSFGGSLGGFSSLFQHRGCSGCGNSMMNGVFLVRLMSTTTGDGVEKIEYMSDVAGVLTDNAVEAVASHAPAVNEVAVAAADSFFPVAYLQYVIDGIHTSTGLPW